MKSKAIAALFIAVALLGAGSVFALGLGMQKYDPKTHNAIQEAIQSGDYAKWKALIEEKNMPMNGRLLSVINEENFHLLKELHDAMLSGDYEKAQQIREELGIGNGMMRKYMEMEKERRGNGMMKRMRFVDRNGDGFCDNLDAETSP